MVYGVDTVEKTRLSKKFRKGDDKPCRRRALTVKKGTFKEDSEGSMSANAC